MLSSRLGFITSIAINSHTDQIRASASSIVSSNVLVRSTTGVSTSFVRARATGPHRRSLSLPSGNLQRAHRFNQWQLFIQPLSYNVSAHPGQFYRQESGQHEFPSAL